jgi:hypothetical protein
MRLSRVVPFATIAKGHALAFLPSLQGPGPAGHARPAAPLDGALAELVDTGALPDSDLALRFFPVYDFQRQGVAALFCTPVCMAAGGEAIYGHKAFHDFSPQRWAQIDCAILSHTLNFAGRLAAGGIVAAVGASVSFAALCDPNGRVLYRDALRAAHAREHAALVIKIEGIPDVTGGRRIAEIVSTIRAYAPRVWVHLPGSHVPLGGHEALHAAGVVLSMPARLPMHGMQTEARWLARTAATQAALACMDHVDTAAELDTTRAAGIRFVAGHALRRPALAGAATLDDIRGTLYGPADASAVA